MAHFTMPASFLRGCSGSELSSSRLYHNTLTTEPSPQPFLKNYMIYICLSISCPHWSQACNGSYSEFSLLVLQPAQHSAHISFWDTVR